MRNARIAAAIAVVLVYAATGSLAAQKSPPPTNVTVRGTGASVTVSWTPVPTRGVTYRILRALDARAPGVDITRPVDAASFVDPNVVRGTTYFYQVIALYGDGTSAAAAPVGFPVPAAAPVVTPVRAPVRDAPLSTKAPVATPPRAVAAPVARAPLQGLPLQPPPQAMPMPGMPQTWDALWDVTWKRAAFDYRIQAAPATLQDPTCRGNLGFDVLVKNTIQAVALKKYGDATRFMGQFQDRSLCLTREGVRGLEFALAMYVHRAVTLLPPQQAQLAVMGVMNLGLQTFDQLQYTGRSWWLPMVNIDYGRIQPLMAWYPRGELGLWMYDFRRGMMVQSVRQDGMDRVLWSMQRLDNFGRGTCMLLDMSDTGFVCPDSAGAAAGGKGGSYGLTPHPGGMPASASSVSCVLDSVNASGVRGQFACMSKALAGWTLDPRTTPADLLKQASQQPGIRDKGCALRDEAAVTPKTDTKPEKPKKEPPAWDKIKDIAGKVVTFVANYVKDVFMARYDKTPAVIDTLGQLASPEGADAARGALQAAQEFEARKSLFTDEGYEDYEKKRNKRVTTDPQANKGRTVDDPTNPDAGCDGKRSNAAARAKSLYDCTMGLDKGHPPQRMGGAGRAQDPRGPWPTIALFDPSQAAGPIPGAMSCLMQAGDLARIGLNDPKCAAMHCMQGQTCPCNRTSAGPGIAPVYRQDNKPGGRDDTPYCAGGDEPCVAAHGLPKEFSPQTQPLPGPRVGPPTPPPGGPPPGGGPSPEPRPIK